MRSHLILFAAFVLMAAGAGCQKEEPEKPATPSTPPPVTPAPKPTARRPMSIALHSDRLSRAPSLLSLPATY